MNNVWQIIKQELNKVKKYNNTLNVLLENGLEWRKHAVFKWRDGSRVQFARCIDDNADRLKQVMIEVRLAGILKQQYKTDKINVCSQLLNKFFPTIMIVRK